MLTQDKSMKSPKEKQESREDHSHFAALKKSLRITFVYLAVGCLWIIFSDLIVEAIFKEMPSVILASIGKGVVYVLATSALIFWLVYRALKNALSAQQCAQAANVQLEKANAELQKEKEKLLESEERIRASEALFRSIFDQDTVGIYISKNSKYVAKIFADSPAINPMYSAITGRSISELTVHSWTDFTHPDDLEADLANFARLKAGDISSYQMEKRYIRPDGSVVWVNKIVSRLYLENLSDFIILCIINDITQRKQQEITLKYLSEHDPLTGIYNRNHFAEILASDIVQSASVKKALLLVALNGFGTVNVTHGYAYGESLVKELAGKLSALMTLNCQLFHIANDRFVFYIRQYESKDDLIKLCQTVTGVLDLCMADTRVRGTIGVLELDSTQTDVDSILKLASIAAEYAMESNTERYSFFDRNMEDAVNRKEMIKSELARCLKNESDTSLYLAYQPIYDAQTGGIFGFEALARFESTQAGLVPPVEFIPIAEEAHLIVPLGNRIIRQACAFLRRLELSGIRDKVVSINISAVQLLRDDFLPGLMNAIAEANVDARNIVLEITESVFVDNFQKINEKLGVIRRKGIGISIDDFGTGYSSLAREIEWNVSCLKLDKQFIDGLLMLDPKEIVVGDIISMAHKLGHYVVAEGVEHEEQMQYLKNCHCDYIQGYLLSRPLPEEKAIQLLG